jgi:hypothetical protein
MARARREGDRGLSAAGMTSEGVIQPSMSRGCPLSPKTTACKQLPNNHIQVQEISKNFKLVSELETILGSMRAEVKILLSMVTLSCNSLA